MGLSKLTSSAREAGPGTLKASRTRHLLLAALAAASISTACGEENPGNTTDAGSTSTDVGGAGGTGGKDVGVGGDGGSGACDTVAFQGLGSKVFMPNETGMLEINGMGGADAVYNGVRVNIVDGEIFENPTMVGVQSVVNDNVPVGYDQIGDLQSMRFVTLNPDQPYVEDEDGNCMFNYEIPNLNAMTDPSKQPKVELPGAYTTVFSIRNGISELATYNLTQDGTTFNMNSFSSSQELSERVDFFPGNSLPEPPVNLKTPYRDDQGHIVVNLDGWTDEGFGDQTVLSKLGAGATGMTLLPMNGEPGKFRSDNPNLASSLDLSVSGLNASMTNDTTMMTSLEVADCNGNGSYDENAEACLCDPGYENDNADASDCDSCAQGYQGYPNCEVIPPPSITNLAVDCSGPPVPNSCVAGGLPYPVSASVTDAINCTATPSVSMGAGTPGSIANEMLNGNNFSAQYTTGSQSGNIIKITVDCTGDGGMNSEFIEFEIQ